MMLMPSSGIHESPLEWLTLLCRIISTLRNLHFRKTRSCALTSTKEHGTFHEKKLEIRYLPHYHLLGQRRIGGSRKALS
jgi:hypothetical protein